MKVAVIFLEKKFIVVVPKDSSVAELKTEIERVHRALFQSSDPPQPVTEIQTLSGCVLYGGYTVSSVLSDNDTVIASGPGGVTPSTSDGITNSPQLCAYTPQSQFLYGHHPLSYYSPVLGAHNVLSHGHLGGSPYTPPQSRILPPLLEAPKISLFQSPLAKTVASQCPSPQYIREEAHQSQPHQTNSEREREDSRLEITEDKGSEEEQTTSSESPLGDLSHLEAKATPQKNILFSTPTPTLSDISVEMTGVRKRKRTPQGKPQDSKKKAAEARKSSLEERKGALEKGKGKGQKALANVQNKGSVSLASTDTCLPEEIKEQPTIPSQSNTDKNSAKSASDSSPSSPFILGTDNNVPSPQSPLAKKRKLSKSTQSTKTTTKNGNKQTVPKKTTTKGRIKPRLAKTKAAIKAKASSNDSDSSGWPTTSDESEVEDVKEKTPPSKRKQLKPVAVEKVSKPKIHEEISPKNEPKKQAVESDSSSEWETEDDTTNTTSSAKPASPDSSATQKSLDPSQPNNRKAKRSAKQHRQPQPGTKPLIQKTAPAEVSDLSSSEWDTDDEIEADSKSHKDREPSQPTKKRIKTGHEKIESRTSDDKKAGKGENSARAAQEKKEKSNSESEQGGSQSEKSLESWSSPSPGNRYTAQDGQRLRQKKPEDLRNCSKQSNLTRKEDTTDTTESSSGAVSADTDTQRVEETTLNVEDKYSDNSVEKYREEKSDVHESDEQKVGTHDVENKEDANREVETNGLRKETEVLAPNSLPSDEEVQMETRSKPQDEVTVIQETQEKYGSSRSPSPEIPLLGHPYNPSHQPFLTSHQKMQEKLTLINSHPLNGPQTHNDENRESDRVKKIDSNAMSSQIKKKDRNAESNQVKDEDSTAESNQVKDGTTESNQVKRKKKNTEPSRKHSDSETDVFVSDSSAQKKKKKRRKIKDKKTKEDKSISDNVAESSDATISGASDSLQLPKKNDSSEKEKPTKSKKDLSESETTESPNQFHNGSAAEKGKAKRKKQKREVKVLSSLDQVPSSQTDQSEEEGTLVIDCDDQLSERETMGSTKSKEAEVEHDSSATVSDAQQSSREGKKLKKKKKQKNKSAPPTTESSVGDEVTETSQSAPNVLQPPVEAPKATELSVDDSEDLGEGTTTDTDMMDITSECSVTPSPSAKRKKKKKHKKKKSVTIPLSHEALAKSTTNPPLSGKSGRRMNKDNDSSAEEDEKSDEDDDSSSVEKKKTVSGASSQRGDSSKDGFLKPTAIPPSKASPNPPPRVQLSPAAGISSPNRVTPSKVKKGRQSKEPSLLSVFSVTETESDESSSERVKPTSRVSHEMRSQKLNFLSSLGSHGKKVHPAKPSTPFSRSSFLTPSPTSRFSSDTAVRMFSFSHSPRSSARKVRPRISPAKTPPAKRKHNEDSLGASLDQLLKETLGEGGGSGEVSVSDLLADGSLWDT